MHRSKSHMGQGGGEHAAHQGYEGHGKRRKRGVYLRLLLMVLVSFIAMYGLMYTMVGRFENAFGNINQVYMAALVAAPMLLVELALMWYPDHHINLGLIAAAGVIVVLSWIGIRSQAFVDDQQFIRSMIPHHAGAILMCEKSRLSEPALKELCGQIVASQTEEIVLMKAHLN